MNRTTWSPGRGHVDVTHPSGEVKRDGGNPRHPERMSLAYLDAFQDPHQRYTLRLSAVLEVLL